MLIVSLIFFSLSLAIYLHVPFKTRMREARRRQEDAMRQDLLGNTADQGDEESIGDTMMYQVPPHFLFI